MKKLLTITACALCTFTIQAQTNDSLNWQRLNESMYCVSFGDGKVIVTHDGKSISQDVLLKSGATITAAGYITWADKSQTKLNSGYCIDETGAVYTPGISLAEQQKKKSTAIAH